MNANIELAHHGVKGMKWGIRKAGIVSTQKRKPPFGAKTDGQHEKSAWMKKWEDDNGINPHRPNGTKPGSQRIARGKNYAKVALGTIGTAAAGTIAAAAITATARRFIMYQFGKAVADGLKG